MNGPLKMYPTRQIIRHDMPVEVSNCMYKMKNLLSGCNIQTSEHVSSPGKNLDITEQKYQTHPEMTALQIRQEKILHQLAELKEQMLSLRSTLNVSTSLTANNSCTTTVQSADIVSSEILNESDLVINVDPSNPPYSLLILQRLWANTLKLVIRTYFHSTVVNLPKAAHDFTAQINADEANNKIPQLLVRLIWKTVDSHMELITSSSLNMPIHGEVNILRYLSRVGPKNFNYELLNNTSDVDCVLDICYLLSRSRTKTERHSLLQSINGKLGKSQWLCNMQQMNIADIATVSVIKQTGIASELNVNLTKWFQRCDK